MDAPGAAGDHLLTWTAMGTTCHVRLLGAGAAEAADDARAEIARLEARWSRFLPGSDVRRLNEARGRAVAVAPETAVLLSEAVAWWAATGGAFDPTVLTALEAAGYDRPRVAGHGPVGAGAPAPGCGGIVVDVDAATAQLPPGVAVDLGGIGKGRAADLVADRLGRHPGGLVDLGGDLRVWGTAPEGSPGWAVAIEDLRDGSTAAVLGLGAGAVATSSTLRRTWTDGRRTAHHLIDPRTGRPTDGELVAATVVAGRATAAEVLAKAAIVAGSLEAAASLLGAHDVPALLIPARGPALAVGGFDTMCWASPAEVA